MEAFVQPSRVQLLVHYLCPFAQRALYVYAFKDINGEIFEVDLANKPDWFWDATPYGTVPVCKVTHDSGENNKLFRS